MIDELAPLLGEIVVNRTTDSGSEGQITLMNRNLCEPIKKTDIKGMVWKNFDCHLEGGRKM